MPRQRVTGIWYAKECPRCEGMAIEYCLREECEGRCDHDKLCPKCKGYGFIPEQADVLFGIVIAPDWREKFPQKKICQEYIETAMEYGSW